MVASRRGSAAWPGTAAANASAKTAMWCAKRMQIIYTIASGRSTVPANRVDGKCITCGISS